MTVSTRASLDLSNKSEIAVKPADRKLNEGSMFDHEYSSDCERMLSQFVESLDDSLESNESLKVLHHADEPFIHISQNPNVSYGYKIVAHLNCTPELAFEYMLNVNRWKQWDEICDCAEIIEAVDPVTRFQHIRTKPVWPISARDVLLLTTMKKLNDGRYVMVGKSMDHDKCPIKKGVLRMEVNFLGIVIFVANGDPKGWVPRNIVKFVATNAIPMSLRILSQSLGSLSSIEYNLVPILNSLSEFTPVTPSSLLSSLRSSILRLSMKSPTNTKSRVSIISSFLLNSKGEGYQRSLSARSVTSVASKASNLSKYSRSESPTLESAVAGEDKPAIAAASTFEPPETPSFSESRSTATYLPSLVDSCAHAINSRSTIPSDSDDMTTTLAPSTISTGTKVVHTKRRRSILVPPKHLTEKIYGKLRRLKLRVQNTMGIPSSKVGHQEFNEKMLDPSLTRYHNGASPGLKVACLNPL
ncbi:Bet v1-like protein [Basidiobolus meristosporus CBS 931.73]|uniref:Bet v1-like protein n=1 Tax=Basidiobolus meristosporus CBS 931.73 TaxID=1314790 RepID=A0A1Y1YLE8_9FUNG|nr:Bet v1-like protein [Basidiobolus meristosporus CBS 931.73]|eukprot:ORX98851.1 Bet v1-like protein [Basidiobolus meristosporus CBS 931.73]